MRFSGTVLSLLSFACTAPNINQANTVDIVDSEEKDIDGDDGLNVEEVEEEEPEETQEASSPPTLVSGIWTVQGASLLEDTCDWDALLMQFFGVGVEALLPSEFTVEGFDDMFEIEANAYGASGPIECELEETDFICTTQSVTPVDFDLGSMGWTYAIDFSGEVSDERSLEGTAIVRFPSVSEFLIPIFEASQVDTSQCTQTFSLSIRSE